MRVSENNEAGRFNAWTDYQQVEKNMLQRLELAVDAHAHVASCESQSIQMSDKSAVEVKKALVSAGTRLIPQLRHNSHVEPFDEIWGRWRGEDGYLSRLRETDFVVEDPEWLDQYAEDLQTAAWHIGYTRAGQEEAADPDDDEVKARELID